jgi:rhodanese-related sulfurtransferase
MPTYFNENDIPTVQFDPQLEISPFKLFRDLKEGREPMIIDVRTGIRAKTIRGAVQEPPQDWEPQPNQNVVLIDDNGSEALPKVQELQERGFGRVKALFGGLDLYEFSLDPQVVGEDTFLEELDGVSDG